MSLNTRHFKRFSLNYPGRNGCKEDQNKEKILLIYFSIRLVLGLYSDAHLRRLHHLNEANINPYYFIVVVNLLLETGGHFAYACVNPLNDNSVGATNLMAGNRKLARKVTVLLKAISLVL